MPEKELLETIEEFGECEFANADDMNIPVGIFLLEIEDDDREGRYFQASHKWVLDAGNYMPRKDSITANAYRATAPTREALVVLVQTRIKPLYDIATKQINSMIEGSNDSLYFWSAP